MSTRLIYNSVLLGLILITCQVQAQMTIHVINVGQGNCVLVQGPQVDGVRKTILFDGGKEERGEELLDYLERIGYEPSNTTFDYMVVSHKDEDHYGGFIPLLNAGYDVDAYYHNSHSPKRGYDDLVNLIDQKARKKHVMQPGYELDLGGGAKATCVITAGKIIGGESVGNLSENDRSIGLLFEYKGFEFFSAGDLGGGDNSAETNCTHRSTGQKDLETPLVNAMVRQRILERDKGIEVLHVGHHGSESSTNSTFMNLMSPSLAVISIGQNQGWNYEHPRYDIVDRVLMATVSCIEVEPALVLQTEEGRQSDKTSFSGYAVGDIIIDVYGDGTYRVTSTGEFLGGVDESRQAGLPLTLKID
ncbi:MAG: MBL fold metallo-hydrolase [Marinoscillum sp.]